MGIKIVGSGVYKPKKILTNFDISKVVDTSDDWIKSRTGIIERRIAVDDEATSDMASKSLQEALKDTGYITPKDLDLIVVATITADTKCPSTAAYVQQKIGAFNAVCFDINAACSGMLYGLEVVNAFMKCNSKYKKVALIGAEKLSSITDWSDRNTCVLFGDAAGTLIFDNIIGNDDFLLSSVLHTDGSNADLLTVLSDDNKISINKNSNIDYIKMDGNKVFKLAINAMFNSCLEVMKLINLQIDDIQWLIPHQANIRIINMLGNKLCIPKEKVVINLQKYGNTSSASIFLALDEYLKNGKIKPNDKILLTAFGGGMTWGSSVIKI